MANYNEYLEYLKHIDNTTEQEIKTKINGLNDEISNFKISLTNLNKAKDDLTNDLVNSKKQINEKIDIINLKESEHRKIESGLEQIKKELEVTQNNLIEKENSYSVLEVNKTALVNEISELKNEYSKISNDFLLYKKDFKNTHSKLSEVEKLYLSEQGKNTSFSSELSELKSTISVLENELKSNRKNESDYIIQIQKLHLDIEGARNDIKNSNSSNIELNQKISNLTSKNLVLESELKTKNKSVSDYISEIQKLHLSLDNSKNDFKNLSSNNTFSNEQILKYKNEIISLNKTIFDLRKESNVAEIKTLKLKLEQTENNRDKIIAEKRLLDNEVKAEREKNIFLNESLIKKNEEIKNISKSYSPYIVSFLAGLLIMWIFSYNNFFMKKTEELSAGTVENVEGVDSLKLAKESSLIKTNTDWIKSDFLTNLEKSSNISSQCEFFQGEVSGIEDETYEFEGMQYKALPVFGKALFDDGSFYEGQFDFNGLRSGKGRKVWQNGEYYQGDFSKNKFEGSGEYHYEDGSYYRGEFSNNQINGIGTMYSKEGTVQNSGNFSQGQLTK